MNLRISTAPHVRDTLTTRSLMTDVMIALAPCALYGIYRFGLYSALLLVISMGVAVLAEFIWQKIMKRTVRVNDGSAMLTGLLVGLNLPPSAPWWLALIGSLLAILLVKQLFGGLGDNFMNPALTARAILLASWPVHMTTYMLPVNSLSFVTDAVTGATPLMGQASYWDLFIGNIPGTMGEICKVAILAGFVYLLIRRVITWRIPVIMLGTTALMSWLLGLDPLTAILSGGVMFGAVFMATDYTTSPMTAVGEIIYAALAGVIVVIIRKYGAYPEGVTYAILLMNVATPLIDKFIKPRLFGRVKEAKENGK